jgi:two-component system, OmpR family, phosphate regulon response regulator OmpR
MLNSHILLIEDDAHLRELLRSYLTKHGFVLSILETGEQAVEVVSRVGVALVLLDVDLPGESGLAVCGRLRAAGCALPIIMITGRSDLEDRILGLEMGADDYMVKPFDPRELLARIGARLRRHAPLLRPSGSGRDASRLRFGPFEFDPARQALSRSGEQLVLTRAELAIFEIFARHPREALARERICELTRRSVATSTRSIDVQIARLRRLLEQDITKPHYIRTVWGVGYAFYPEAPAESASVPVGTMLHG